MTNLLDLAELQSDDAELIPEILPVDARLSIKGDVSLLVELFERAASITPVKEVISGTKFALLEAVPPSATAVGFVRISATDGDQTVAVVTDGLVINRAGSVLVPAKRMLDILKLVPDSAVRIDVLGSSATIQSGRAQWTVQTPTGDSLPIVASAGNLELSPVSREELLEALKIVRTAIGSGNGRPALGQIMIRNQRVTACDGGRLHRQFVESLDPMLEMSIPTKTVDEVIRALRSSEEEFVELGADDYHLVFQVGRDSLIAQRLLVQFPDVESLILTPAFSNLHELTVEPLQLIDAVKRVRVNADPDNAGIFLTVVKGMNANTEWCLSVSAKDRNGNSSQEIIDCNWEGPAKGHMLCLNHRYLSDFLQAFPTAAPIVLKLGADTKTSRSPLFVEDESGFTGLIQQMNPAWVG